MLSDTDLQTLLDLAEHHWHQPSRHWSSGGDKRSSDAAMLVLMHGGLASAARHEWLNAGRRIIDKTSIDILMHARGLAAMRAVSPERIAAALDNQFIPQRIAPSWETFTELDDEAALNESIALVQTAATELFGSLHSEVIACQLLFHLLPQLPLFPFSRGHAAALAELDGVAPAADYDAFARRCAAHQTKLPELLEQSAPQAHYGTARELAACDEALSDGDWWARRLFELHLQQLLPEADFGCDSEGR